MEITLIIVGGITVMTVVGMLGDYLTKTKLAKLSVDPKIVQGMEQRIESLEKQILEQESKISLLQNDVSFTTKLLESTNH